jgi:hypothetical protein
VRPVIGEPHKLDGRLRRVEPAGPASRRPGRCLADARTVLWPPPLLHRGPISGSEERATQGLLKSVFHDPGASGRRRDVQVFREQLHDSVFTKVGEISGKSLEVACLPLFSRDGRQVVRFELPREGRELKVRLEGVGGWWELGNCFTDVLVPQVSASERRSFEVVGAGGEALYRGEVTVRPQRKWSVWLVHHSHLDIGYTDRREVVADNHLQYLDSALDLIESTSSWDDDARFRWNVEVNWPLERWFASRDKAQHKRMVEAIRSGHISVGVMSLNLHTEACSVDELYEMTRFAVELRQRYGLVLPAAMQTDVPGAVTGLIEVLADADAHYLSLAHNYAGRSVPYLIGGEKLERPFYWQAREEASSLVSKAARRAAARVGSDGGPSVVAFNASGWTRTDVVRVFLPFSVVPEGTGVVAQDERDGARLPTLESSQEHSEHRPAGRFLTFLASCVPALGYALFRLVPGAPAPVEARAGQAEIENDSYRLTVSTEAAAVSSIIDLASGRDLVNHDALLGFNAYVFDRYGTATRVDHLSGRVFTRALDLVAGRQTSKTGVVACNDSSELGETLTLDVRAPGCARLLSTVTLWRSVPRIEISNRLWKLPTEGKESVFFPFPFAAAQAELSYELPGVSTKASAPRVPGCPQHMRAVRH